MVACCISTQLRTSNHVEVYQMLLKRNLHNMEFYWSQIAGPSGRFESHRGHGCLSVVCCQVEVSVTSWSLVQRRPTDRGAWLCVITKPLGRWGHSPRWAAEPEKQLIPNWPQTTRNTLCMCRDIYFATVISIFIKRNTWTTRYENTLLSYTGFDPETTVVPST
jgi:hypothetical protein